MKWIGAAEEESQAVVNPGHVGSMLSADRLMGEFPVENKWIKSAVMSKMGTDNKWQQRRFILTDYMMLWCRSALLQILAHPV
jgi:hypothetical protein